MVGVHPFLMSVPKQPPKNTDTNSNILFFMPFFKDSSNSKPITFIGHPKNKFLEINIILILK